MGSFALVRDQGSMGNDALTGFCLVTLSSEPVL
jgi:hypothetical protein